MSNDLVQSLTHCSLAAVGQLGSLQQLIDEAETDREVGQKKHLVQNQFFVFFLNQQLISVTIVYKEVFYRMAIEYFVKRKCKTTVG